MVTSQNENTQVNLRDEYYSLGAYFACNKLDENNHSKYERFQYLESLFIEDPVLRSLEHLGIFIDR